MRGTRKRLEQTSSENYLNVTKNTTPTIRVSHLLAAASVSALAMALPGPVGIYGTRAWAQALPPGCEDETGDTTANDGEVIECEGDPTTGELDPVSTNVDDLTLILGSESNGLQIARVPGSSAPGVQMGGNGAQSLTIRNANSTIAGDTHGVKVFVNSDSATETNDLSIVSDGSITGETARHTVFGSGGQARYHGAGLGAHHIDAGIRVAWERVHGDRVIDTDAYLDVEGAVFTPTAALLDRDRIAISLDTKVYFTEQLFGYVRYDTRRGENLIENEGWAGVTFKF
jgi:hypothetical protein